MKVSTTAGRRSQGRDSDAAGEAQQVGVRTAEPGPLPPGVFETIDDGIELGTLWQDCWGCGYLHPIGECVSPPPGSDPTGRGFGVPGDPRTAKVESQNPAHGAERSASRQAVPAG